MGIKTNGASSDDFASVASQKLAVGTLQFLNFFCDVEAERCVNLLALGPRPAFKDFVVGSCVFVGSRLRDLDSVPDGRPDGSLPGFVELVEEGIGAESEIENDVGRGRGCTEASLSKVEQGTGMPSEDVDKFGRSGLKQYTLNQRRAGVRPVKGGVDTNLWPGGEPTDDMAGRMKSREGCRHNLV